MKRHILVIVLLNCFALQGYAFAGDPGTKLVQVAGNHNKSLEPVRADGALNWDAASAPTMLSEIRAVMDSTRNAELSLRQELGDIEGSELTRRLGELKTASRMRILHIQLNYARDEGRYELERRILTSIEDLQRPAAPGGPLLTGRISPPSGSKPVEKPVGGS